MPLRDHFRSPLQDRKPWNELHGQWPAMIVRELFDILPPGFSASPAVYLGSMFEIDVSAFREGASDTGFAPSVGSVATLDPTLTIETDLAGQDEVEVRVYDEFRRLVAAIELVSPANKDRPESREAFVAKVAALLKKDVCVSIVDLVTVRRSNLYADLLKFLGRADPQLSAAASETYAVALRSRRPPKQPSLLDAWYYPMIVGQQLPTLPIWLAPDLRVMLPLESSYEETCRLLHFD